MIAESAMGGYSPHLSWKNHLIIVARSRATSDYMRIKVLNVHFAKS